jgi:hypothetical protein
VGLAQQRYVKSHRNLFRSPRSGPHPGTPHRPIRVTGVGRPLDSFCFRFLLSMIRPNGRNCCRRWPMGRRPPGASESLWRVCSLGGQASGFGRNQAPETDRLNQVPPWEFRKRRKSFTPRQLARILWDFTYLCWANTEYFEPVCDGTGWSAEITYPDKALHSHGSNCFPGDDGNPVSIANRRNGDTFQQFCSAVSLLVGRAFR